MKKTITAIAAAAALALGLAACAVPDADSYAYEETYGEVYQAPYEESYGLDESGKIDSDLAEDGFALAWDMTDEETKSLACQAWNDPSISEEDFLDAFRLGAGDVFSDADVLTFFSSVC